MLPLRLNLRRAIGWSPWCPFSCCRADKNPHCGRPFGACGVFITLGAETVNHFSGVNRSNTPNSVTMLRACCFHTMISFIITPLLTTLATLILVPFVSLLSAAPGHVFQFA